MFQVQALYDFEAQPGTGEISINAGDVLTVTRTDVGEGWWEGTNTKGETGLFPEAYVEVRKVQSYVNTVWKLENFSATQILRESNS